LVGEGASDKDTDKITDAIVATPGVDSLIHIKTLYLGPDELMVAAKFAVGKKATAQDIAKTIDDAEVMIRKAVPAARVIYLEPDILRDSKN
jgi:divalent metal cation (Fe/Co/Zn/Cd) transporter